MQGSGVIDGRGQKWWDLPCKPHKKVYIFFYPLSLNLNNNNNNTTPSGLLPLITNFHFSISGNQWNNTTWSM